MLFSSSHDPRSVWDLFEDWAKKQPNHIAIVQGARRITYQQLHDAASRIAGLLASCSVRHGDPVPVLARRTPEMVACFLAIIQAGACYVPIDTESWSDERVNWTLNAVNATVVLDSDGSINQPVDQTGLKVIVFQEIEAAFAESNIYKSDVLTFSKALVEPTDLAYIIFTSGTTSTPKGVMIPHRALLNYVQQGNEETPFNGDPTPADTLLLIFSPGFDGRSLDEYSY